MFKMKKLTWLDLKDNPLDKELKSVAGDCLDEKQCKKCAKDVSYLNFICLVWFVLIIAHGSDMHIHALMFKDTQGSCLKGST